MLYSCLHLVGLLQWRATSTEIPGDTSSANVHVLYRITRSTARQIGFVPTITRLDRSGRQPIAALPSSTSEKRRRRRATCFGESWLYFIKSNTALRFTQVKHLEGDLLGHISFIPRCILTSTRSGHIKLWIRPLALRPRHTRTGHMRAVTTDVEDLL